MTQISSKLRITTLAVLFTFCSMMTATTTGAMAATTSAKSTAPTAYLQGSDALGNVLNGVFSIKSFSSSGNQLVASGILNGTITSATGVVTQVTNQLITLPVAGLSATCPILSLTLGPLDLNLLGLVIHLNQVVLNITAVSGAGNLLGNLLCAVANLLNGGNLTSILDTLVADLNAILRAL
ncbi:MAG TPA: hypothetical protein VFD30_07315 [Terriglobia bacterium]|nr:hypothetical protein [Terriglobia bacterium]